MLWSESGAGSLGNIRFQFLDTAMFGRRIFEFVTASSEMSLLTGNATTDHGGEAFTPTQDYLLVGKIDARASAGANDTIPFSIWQNGTTIGSEPVTWDVSGLVEAGDTDRVINRLFVNGNGNVDRFDEFRLGDTFADVTGVPEPGTLARLESVLAELE